MTIFIFSSTGFFTRVYMCLCIPWVRNLCSFVLFIPVRCIGIRDYDYTLYKCTVYHSRIEWGQREEKSPDHIKRNLLRIHVGLYSVGPPLWWITIYCFFPAVTPICWRNRVGFCVRLTRATNNNNRPHGLSDTIFHVRFFFFWFHFYVVESLTLASKCNETPHKFELTWKTFMTASNVSLKVILQHKMHLYLPFADGKWIFIEMKIPNALWFVWGDSNH